MAATTLRVRIYYNEHRDGARFLSRNQKIDQRMTKVTKIIIPGKIHSQGEQPRAIYSEATSKIMEALGNTETTRASHVEPGSELRQEALTILFRNGFAKHAEIDTPHYEILDEYKSHWFADMTPSGHDIVLGPYPPEARDIALKEEVEWLHLHKIPSCAKSTEEQGEDTAQQD